MYRKNFLSPHASVDNFRDPEIIQDALFRSSPFKRTATARHGLPFVVPGVCFWLLNVLAGLFRTTKSESSPGSKQETRDCNMTPNPPTVIPPGAVTVNSLLCYQPP